MKNTLLLLIISIGLNAQNVNYFPVSPKGQALSLDQRLIREGYPYTVYSPSYNVIWTGQVAGSGQSLGGMVAPSSTKGYYITSMSFTSSRPCFLQSIGMYYQSLGAYPVSAINLFVGPGGTTMPLNMMIRNGMRLPTISLLDFPEANSSSTIAYSPTNGIVMTKSNQVSMPLQRCSTVVTCTNSTGGSVVNFVVKDKMPPYFRYVTAQGTNFTFSYDSTQRMLTGNYTGTLANAATATYSVTGQVMESLDISVSISGYIVDSDVDYNGQPLVVCGTSISDGTGINSLSESYLQQVKSFMKDVKDVKLRLVNKSIPGTTSVHHETLRKSENRYDFIEPPRLFIYEQGGINDQSQSVPIDTTLANITRAIRNLEKQAPFCHFFLLAPFPTQNVTNEAGLVTRRAAFASYVAGLTGRDATYVHYISTTGNMFNPVTQSGTYTTDGLHLNAAGNALAAKQIINYIIANPSFVY